MSSRWDERRRALADRRGIWEWSDPRIFLLAALVTLTVVGIWVHGIDSVLLQTVLAVATAGGLDVALRALLTGVRATPVGGLISGFIVALLLPAGVPWYVPVVAAALAVLSKHLLRRRGGNVFNPAAAGVAVSVLLFPGALQYSHAAYLDPAPRLYFAQSHLRMDRWSFLVDGGHGWIGSTSAVAVVVLGALLIRRVGRFELIASYLVTYVTLVTGFALLTGQDLATRLILEVFPTGVPFFVFIMVTDPATSPGSARGRTVYGAFTAGLSFALRMITSPVQFLLLALLAANLVLSFRPELRRALPLGRREPPLTADAR